MTFVAYIYPGFGYLDHYIVFVTPLPLPSILVFLIVLFFIWMENRIYCMRHSVKVDFTTLVNVWPEVKRFLLTNLRLIIGDRDASGDFVVCTISDPNAQETESS